MLVGEELAAGGQHHLKVVQERKPAGGYSGATVKAPLLNGPVP